MRRTIIEHTSLCRGTTELSGGSLVFAYLDHNKLDHNKTVALNHDKRQPKLSLRIVNTAVVKESTTCPGC